jgi:hypothetical protein
MSKINAESSKEPVNDAKSIKNKNALVHGVYAEDVVLPWESREDFEKLLADLREEFGPDGRMEEEIVLDLAHLRWQKQRVRKMWLAASNSDPFVNDLVESGKKTWSEIRDHLQGQAKVVRSLTDAVRSRFLELVKHVNARSGDLIKGLEWQRQKEANEASNDHDLGGVRAESEHPVRALSNDRSSSIRTLEFESRMQMQMEGLEGVSERLMSLVKLMQSLPDAETTLGRAYSPGYLEPVIRIEALIDARIDKLLGRLVSLKCPS